MEILALTLAGVDGDGFCLRFGKSSRITRAACFTSLSKRNVLGYVCTIAGAGRRRGKRKREKGHRWVCCVASNTPFAAFWRVLAILAWRGEFGMGKMGRSFSIQAAGSLARVCVFGRIIENVD